MKLEDKLFVDDKYYVILLLVDVLGEYKKIIVIVNKFI